MQKAPAKRDSSFLADLGNLEKFAEKTAKTVKGGEVIALIGELGAGKTTFVKAFLKSKGIRKKVSSPTFSLVVPYSSGKMIYHHVDLYRINGAQEFKALGIPDLWNKKNNVFLIEWADKIKKVLPPGTIKINFKKVANPKLRNLRKISVSGLKKKSK